MLTIPTTCNILVTTTGEMMDVDDVDDVEIIELDNEIIEIVQDDSPTGEAVSDSLGEKFTSNFKSLRYTEQLLAIEQLRISLRITSCPLVYNPACSFAFNLALKINSTNFEAFKENVESLDNLLAMGNAVTRVYRDCNSQQWLTHIIKKTVEINAEPSNEVEKFYRKLWDMKKEENFPPAIVRLVVLTYPAVLEDSVIELVTKCAEIDILALQNHLADVFNSESVKAWVRICSKCPQMFQTSCSMIQTLSHFSRGNKKVLAFAQTFHQATRDSCDLFHLLFPVHLRLLVRKLETRTSGDEEVLNELSDLMVVERPACQTLLTCFPKWLPMLFVFAVNHHVASIISEEFGDWHD